MGHSGRSGWRIAAITALASSVLAVGAASLPAQHVGASTGSVSFARPKVGQPAFPVWGQDAPDPAIVEFGSTFYAYTTGTTWGNHLGVLESSSPASGWHTTTGNDYGSSALPKPPAWQAVNSQTSPSVAYIGGRYVMFYDALLKSNTSLYCLSVAKSSTPKGPFGDSSRGPFGPCSAKWKGTIDPDVVTTASGRHWLLWKENGSGRYGSAQIWSQELSANGLSLVGLARVLLTQASATFHWETTTEDPAIVHASGIWWLIFSAGSWRNSTYSEAFVKCSGGPAGPCGTDPTQILQSYGSVHGPGGGAPFETSHQVWYLDFAAWTGGCSGVGRSCARELYVAPIEFGPLAITTKSLAAGTVAKPYRSALASDGGLGTHTWTSTKLPPGLRLNSVSGEVLGTPSTAGSRSVTFTVSTGHETVRRAMTIVVKS